MVEIDLKGVRRQRGYLLRTLREAKGLRQPDVARVAGLSRTRLNKVERGYCRLKFERLMTLLNIFEPDGPTTGLLMSLDLLERVAMLPEPLQRVFRLAAEGFDEKLAAVTGIDPREGQSLRVAT